jgi:hypothetical protein
MHCVGGQAHSTGGVSLCEPVNQHQSRRFLSGTLAEPQQLGQSLKLLGSHARPG